MIDEINENDVVKLYEKLQIYSNKSGYNLNPDEKFSKAICKGLLMNLKNYGYMSCPCRVAVSNIAEDKDIVCPCDYRDADIAEFGACYCGLYVSEEVVKGKKLMHPIPERRPGQLERSKLSKLAKSNVIPSGLPFPVWRCTVCGYICARDTPPEICPICGVKKDRFTLFIGK